MSCRLSSWTLQLSFIHFTPPSCGNILWFRSSSSIVVRNLERMSRDCEPFVCPDCDKKFKYSSHLNRHRRIHTGEKLFACTECERSSNKVVTWMCIAEFIRVKSRSPVLIVTRTSPKVANWIRIVEFILVKSRSHVLIVTKVQRKY